MIQNLARRKNNRFNDGKTWKIKVSWVWINLESGINQEGLDYCSLWQYGLWSFKTGGTKLESKEIIEFWELDCLGPQKFSKIRVLEINYFHPPIHLSNSLYQKLGSLPLIFWEDGKNWLLKFWFLKTSEAHTNPILKIQ